jgi:hypothetical protein
MFTFTPASCHWSEYPYAFINGIISDYGHISTFIYSLCICKIPALVMKVYQTKAFMLASWHVLYQLTIYGSTFSTDTTGLLHHLVIWCSTLWTDRGLLHQLATYSSTHCTDTMLAAPTGHIQQYIMHWHNACYTSLPFTGTLWTDTTGLLHHPVICCRTLWTDTGLLHQLATYSSTHCTDTTPAAPACHLWQYTLKWHNRFAAPTGHIQQYTLHWHNAHCTSLPFMAVHYELTQQVCCTIWPYTAVHTALTQCLLHQFTIYGSTLWCVTIGLLHQVAKYSSIHCNDTMPAAPAGNLWQYTLNWQQVFYTSWPLTTIHFALTQYASGEKPRLVYRPLVSQTHYVSLI